MFDDPAEYILPGVRLVKGDRLPCPVCGHPTGDCAGSSKSPVRILGEEFYKKKDENLVLVPEDLYEEVYITQFTKTTVLVAKAGTYIPLEKAMKHGLISRPGS
jgi:hypothetical protein